MLASHIGHNIDSLGTGLSAAGQIKPEMQRGPRPEFSGGAARRQAKERRGRRSADNCRRAETNFLLFASTGRWRLAPVWSAGPTVLQLVAISPRKALNH